MAIESGYPLSHEYGRRTGIIVVLVPHLRSSEFGELAHSIIRAASDRDHAVVIQETNQRFSDENRALRLFKRLKVDGVTLTSSSIHVGTIVNLFESETKVVSISHQIKSAKLGLHVTGSKIDGRAGTRDMCEYLVKLGHRRICFFDGSNISTGTINMSSGYMDATSAFNSSSSEEIPVQVVRSDTASGDYYQIGTTRCEELLRQPEERSTAIICYNDEMALGVIKCLKDSGISVPDEVSVAGTHDIRESRHSTPLQRLLQLATTKRNLASEPSNSS